jgi:HPt (histidine-containing phosphotransfer) domain-containing protein
MASFIYIYSRFTEELLLLSAAGIFALLSAYCYYWVIRKRRLGAARNEIPATVVKAYLGQLINEAQFVRTQLFGIAQANLPGAAEAHASSPLPGLDPLAPTGISGDLSDRLRALQSQLSEKESLVVNINIEKTKLLEELENLRQNQHAIQSASSSSGSEDMAKTIKTLQERLEEYSLFEEDLANLKRLQQENTNLKKRIEEMTGTPPEPKIAAVPASVPTPPPTSPEPSITPPQAAKFDQDAIDALLDGTPAIPPSSEPPVEPSIAETKPGSDEFERLVDSVESSLDPAPGAAPVETAAAPAPTTSPSAPETLATKSDEELLKEFENLLNS